MMPFDTKLNDAQIELLSLAAEECAETIQAITKILRHGYDSVNPLVDNSPTNREHLEKEIGDLTAAVAMLCASGDISKVTYLHHANEKVAKVGQWLHFTKMTNDQSPAA